MENSPLSRLPTELRDEIWTLVFDGLWTDVSIALFRTLRLKNRTQHEGGHPKLALLLTCKRINIEAGAVAWAASSATLDCLERMTEGLEKSELQRQPVEQELRTRIMKTWCRMWQLYGYGWERMQVAVGHRLSSVTTLHVGLKDSSVKLKVGVLIRMARGPITTPEVLPYGGPADVIKACLRSLTKLRRITIHGHAADMTFFSRDCATLKYFQPLLMWTPGVQEIVFTCPGEVRVIEVEQHSMKA